MLLYGIGSNISRPSRNLHILVFVPHAVEFAVFLFAVVLYVTDDAMTDSPGIVAGLLGIELHLGGDGADLAAHALDVLLAQRFSSLCLVTVYHSAGRVSSPKSEIREIFLSCFWNKRAI